MHYVIPHYGSKFLLKKTIKSIQTTDSRASIYIGDDSGRLRKKEFPNIQIIAGPKRGFAPNVNNLMKQIKKGWVCIVNNDMELDADWKKHINRCIKEAKGSKRCIIASKVINKNGLIDSAGDCFSWFGQGYNRLHLKMIHEKVNESEKIVGATGGLMVVEASVFHSLNGFDEQFGSYVEDTDFNIRAVKAGIKPIFCTKATAVHFGSATFNDYAKQYYSARNSVLNIKKNFIGTLKSQLMFRNIYYWRLKRTLKPHLKEPINKGLKDGLTMKIERINEGAKIKRLSQISNDSFVKSFWRLINL